VQCARAATSTPGQKVKHKTVGGGGHGGAQTAVGEPRPDADRPNRCALPHPGLGLDSSMEARDAPEGMVKQLPARRAAGLVLQLIRQGTMIDRTKTQLFLR
jgi:hypothetical protein